MLTIENNVLVKCDENATEVVIPEGVTEINWGAFKDCSNPADDLIDIEDYD